MRKKRLETLGELFRREGRDFVCEPVTHRLNPHPVLPKGMMSAMAPAYEEALEKEKASQERQG